MLKTSSPSRWYITIRSRGEYRTEHFTNATSAMRRTKYLRAHGVNVTDPIPCGL